MINMSDFMGIKKSDSIEHFYEIEKVIGRGKYKSLFYIFNRSIWGSRQGQTFILKRI